LDFHGRRRERRQQAVIAILGRPLRIPVAHGVVIRGMPRRDLTTRVSAAASAAAASASTSTTPSEVDVNAAEMAEDHVGDAAELRVGRCRPIDEHQQRRAGTCRPETVQVPDHVVSPELAFGPPRTVDVQ
jgi:hypothetical protein